MKRRTKPNRNGGRAHGGGGNHHGGQNQSQMGSRKGGNSAFGHEDLEILEDEPIESEDESDDEWVMDDEDEEQATGTIGRKEFDSNKPRERRKVEMSILHMSDQSQEMVIQMLKELHGSQYKMRDASAYVDAGQRMDRRFWIQDRLRVTNVINFSEPKVNDPDSQKDTFGIKKLESYGFHTSRCVEALEKANDDVGQAFESLMTDLFELNHNCQSDLDLESVEDQKEDEKLAIQSIYGDDALCESIPGKLWEIKLLLPQLEGLLLQQIQKSSMNSKSKAKSGPTLKELQQDSNVCQWFLRGHCKFGRRCYKKHVTPEKESYIDDKHLQDLNAQDKGFILEIRFPENSSYPMTPPLASINTPMKIPRQSCLKITAKLMEEAKLLAQDHVPSVFSLINLLENTDEMRKALEGQDVKFSFGIGLEPEEETSNINDTDRLMSSLGISSASSDKSNVGQNQYQKKEFQKDDAKIIERYQKKIPNAKMMELRQSLPAWKEKDSITEALKNHQVMVISGMTGCGKSTQVPQYILDHNLGRKIVPNIICTQPRRISAIGVAERVAEERDEKIGHLVGYQIRLESKTSHWTRLLFCTTGILLRRLESDPELKDVTHVIIDEVHERSEESDFLLMIIRDLLPKRPKLKILLMSATLNASSFASYFGQAVPMMDIPGRTFPVKQIFLEEILDRIQFTIEEHSQYAKKISKHESNHSNKSAVEMAKKKINKMGKDIFLDDYDAEMLFGDSGSDVKPAKDNVPDEKLSMNQIQLRYSQCPELVKRVLSLMDFEKINYDLIEAVIEYILEGPDFPKKGSILVFLPGLQEIMTLYDQICKNPRISKCKLLPLHSSLSSEEQSLIFCKTKQRKIVISTNLAETSITIDDCVFVVEVGKMKEKRFDPTKNMESLETIWVSNANALQRKGRAGRVMSGYCFHLYTHFRFDHHFRSYPIPEIQRVPLEQMLLRIKIMPLFETKPSVQDVLKNLIEPPANESVYQSLKRLRDVGAIDQEESLTPLGYHLANLPVDVRIGKLIIFGSVFKCLDSALTIAACLSYRSPFVSPFGKREEARKKKREFALWSSDQITDMQAYNAWTKAQRTSYAAGYAFAQENYLSIKTLQTIVSMKHQFAELLSTIGFITSGISSRRLDKAGKFGTDGIESLIDSELNSNNKNGKLLLSILCAALYPNVVQVLSPKTKFQQTTSGAMAKVTAIEDLRFRTKSDGFVNLHPSSVIAHRHSAGQTMDSAYIVYHEKIKTSRIFVRECSLVPIYSMVVFGGYGVEVELQRGQFVLSMEEGWIKFVTFSHVIAECLKEMRQELEHLLQEKIANPNLNLCTNARGKLIIDTIVKLILKE